MRGCVGNIQESHIEIYLEATVENSAVTLCFSTSAIFTMRLCPAGFSVLLLCDGGADSDIVAPAYFKWN